MKVEDITVLNIDGVPYAVDGMSDSVKLMVGIFNDWNRREAEARDELMLVQSAKNDLSRQIIMQVRKEKEEAEASAAATETPAGDDGANDAPAAE